MARFSFRHGIARRQQDTSNQPNNLQPSNGGSYVDVIVSPDPTVFLISHFDTDYVQTESASLSRAWGPFTTGNNYWLYWDVDFQTGEMTHQYTTLEPSFGHVAPTDPEVDEHWFDTKTMVQKVWTGASWVEKLRCFAAKYQGGSTLVHYPLGSQVGVNNTTVNAGKILFDPDGEPLQKFQRNRRGQFITTETPMHSQFNRIANFRVEAAIVQGEAQEYIPDNYAVALTGFDELSLARNDSDSHIAIGISTEEMYPGEVRSYMTKGFLIDEVNWDWSAYPARTPLFLGQTGQLVVEPEAQATIQQQLGYIVNRNTIFVEIGQPVLLEPPEGNEVGMFVNRDTGRRIGRRIPFKLDHLKDVESSNPRNGDVIRWSSAENQWVLYSGCCEGGGGPGATALNDLTDVEAGGTIEDGYSLTYDANTGTWKPEEKIQSLSQLNDVISTPSEGDYLVFRNNWWVSEPLSAGVSDHTLLTNIGTNTHDDIDVHIADDTIHFTMADIRILEAQITDLQDYLLDAPSDGINYVRRDGAWEVSPAISDHTLLDNIGTNSHTDIDAHIADALIHFTMGDISITESQISDLQPYLLDAPTDNQQYVRKNGVWQLLTVSSGVTDHNMLSGIGTNSHEDIDLHIADTDIHFSDAPIDGGEYFRKDGAWVYFDASSLQISESQITDLGDYLTDAPVDGNEYVRVNGMWAQSTSSGTATATAGLFVTNVTSPGGGIISDFGYAPNTVPSNVVVTQATSDEETVRIHFIVEGARALYSPTVAVDITDGNVPGILTQDPDDIRTFQGYADVNIADGLTAGRLIELEASHGATAAVLIKRAPEAPEVRSMVFDTIFPVVPPDAFSGYPGGTQTDIKAGDDFYVTGTVDNSATRVDLNSGLAVSSGTYNTNGSGSNLGADNSGGPGLKAFTIRFTASSANGSQFAEARARNSFGSYGNDFITTNSVFLDQQGPSVSFGAFNYPAGQQALKDSEVVNVNNSVSGHDYVYYYENGGAGFISIANQTTYEAVKAVTRIGGNYVYDGNNIRIKAYKTSNGTNQTRTGDVNISNVAPTVQITGASSRLISSPGGQNYTITMNFSQRLLQAPSIVSSGDPNAGSRGTVSGSGTSWTFTLNVDDADIKGVYNWTVNNVNTLSDNTYNGITISSGGSYEIGGFTNRIVTVGALEQVVDLGVDITDPSKVVVKYAGTADNLAYRGSDLSQFQKGWSAVDGAQLVFTAGADPFPNYSNFVFEDPTVTPTSWFYLTDAAFAGSNTTGTLQLEIREGA